MICLMELISYAGFVFGFILVYLRKLTDDERPLHLRLCAGPNEKVLSLVLKENETGEVNVSTSSADSLSILTSRLEPTHLYQAQKKK